jgi:hypothetical protein
VATDTVLTRRNRHHDVTPAPDRPVRTGVGRFIKAGYCVAALFFFVPLMDIFTAALPIAPGIISWRYGTIGAAANYLLSMVFGLFLGLVIAAAAEEKGPLKAWSLLTIASGVVLTLLSLEFALDFFQLRSVVRPEAVFAFRVGFGKAWLKYLLAAVSLLYMGIKGWRTRERPVILV